ncbi:MAG: PEP-CTERM sorting domain-containing protein [Planctomycetes bacterium]|nr:PEP-CTERM sorting domain-containing protein [Planctomycetota bacterium]
MGYQYTPEPSSSALLASGGLAFFLHRRRQLIGAPCATAFSYPRRRFAGGVGI